MYFETEVDLDYKLHLCYYKLLYINNMLGGLDKQF